MPNCPPGCLLEAKPNQLKNILANDKHCPNLQGLAKNQSLLYFRGGTTPFFPETFSFFCSCHNFFSLSSVQIIFIPACCLFSAVRLFSTLELRGGSPEKNSDSSVSQLSALATLRPIWGRCGQGAFELSLPQIRLFFLEKPLRVWIYLLRKYAYRDFLYHLKANTISNKLV